MILCYSDLNRQETDASWEYQKEEERNKRNILINNDWESSQVNVRHQTTDAGSSENTKQDKSWHCASPSAPTLHRH